MASTAQEEIMMWLCFLMLAFSGSKQPFTYAAGYIPNIQFAPFYIAQLRGYYAEEGLEVTLDYTMGPDVLKLTALGKFDIASADPDAFLHAASRGLPLTHVATLYQSYPLALIAKEDYFKAGQLKGKTVGISGKYGSSYLGLKVMLAELGLELSDIQLNSIGFTQIAALQQGRVDVVVGYANNEPLRLKQLGVEVALYTPSEGGALPGVGLMASRKTLANKSEAVQGFLRATFRGLQDVIAEPRVCYELVVKEILPDLASDDRFEAEYKVLEASLPYWTSAETASVGFGQTDIGKWEHLVKVLNTDTTTSMKGKNWRQWLDRRFHYKPAQ
jgi:NitT/TauT family transport system substrate-binding protein